jgi:hypothetical protein
MSITARIMVLLDNLHVTSCKDDGATVLDNPDFFLKPSYAPHPVHPRAMMQTADNVPYNAHYVSHVQQGVHAAVNVGDMTVFPMLYADSFNAMLLHHGSNVMHVTSVQ